jgi:putative hydrolase of the HAD superfamily
MISGVIFDLFGTLTGGESARDHHLEAMAKALGAPPDDFRRVMRESFDRRAKGHLGGLRQTLGIVCDELGLTPSSKTLEQAVQIRMNGELQMLQPRQGAVEILHELRDRGLRIGLLSDCTPEILDIWPGLAYADLFDSAIRSCEVGWRKPDPRMYEAVLRGLGLEAADCLYVGDGGSSELRGAEAVGLRPVLLRVAGEEYFRYDQEASWSGQTIEHLGQVLTLLDGDR